jgi:hypothetical protein
VRYDYDGNGHAEATGWVGGGDSLLVRDADGNGTVSDASEFVFGGNGLTDLQALHGQYGEQLDASDADYSKFKVWNDANSNGVADGGELQSLTEAGIVAINLVSDGVVSSAAGGDVTVAGEGQPGRGEHSRGRVIGTGIGQGFGAGRGASGGHDGLVRGHRRSLSSFARE